MPPIEDGAINTGLATTVLDRHAGIGLFQCGKDLTFSKTGRLPTRS